VVALDDDDAIVDRAADLQRFFGMSSHALRRSSPVAEWTIRKSHFVALTAPGDRRGTAQQLWTGETTRLATITSAIIAANVSEEGTAASSEVIHGSARSLEAAGFDRDTVRRELNAR